MVRGANKFAPAGSRVGNHPIAGIFSRTHNASLTAHALTATCALGSIQHKLENPVKPDHRTTAGRCLRDVG
jgi:hypothetical protein